MLRNLETESEKWRRWEQDRRTGIRRNEEEENSDPQGYFDSKEGEQMQNYAFLPGIFVNAKRNPFFLLVLWPVSVNEEIVECARKSSARYCMGSTLSNHFTEHRN